MRRILRRLITYPLLLIALILLPVEEILWRLAGVLAIIGRLPLFRNLEAWIRGLPPYAALALFGTPALCLMPVKLLAWYWVAGGHPIFGIGTILTAKVAGTAVVARLFQLTQPQLLSIGWFAWAHGKVMALREAAYGLWWKTPAGRWWRRTREARRHWIHRRWDAIRAYVSRPDRLVARDRDN
jgi:hypothetical protein